MISTRMLFPDTERKIENEMVWNYKDIMYDLDIDFILKKMSGNDDFVYNACRKVLFNPVYDAEVIRYRQEAVKDAINNPDTVKNIYFTLRQSVEDAKKRHFWVSNSNPEFNLHISLAVLEIYLGSMEKLRSLIEINVSRFSSKAFSQLFQMIIQEFNDSYIHEIRDHIHNLSFPRGVYVRGKLGKGLSLTDFTLLVPDTKSPGLFGRVRNLRERRFTFTLDSRDEIGAQVMANMRSRSLKAVSEIVTSSSENFLRFINDLMEEIAFYVGCIQLHYELEQIGVEHAFPTVLEEDSNFLYFSGLYDVALALRQGIPPVVNSLDRDQTELIFISGANRGGKSTLLRAMGQASLMMMAGMFVGSKSFGSRLYKGIYTHFRREEDADLRMGKFDEELSRFSEIVDHLKPCSLVLFNESFSSTNEIEGSEIASGIIDALLERNIRIIFVTHSISLLEKYSGKHGVVFLVAERLSNGTRTFRFIRSEPQATSFGMDIFKQVFRDVPGLIDQATINTMPGYDSSFPHA